jgi:hypothetical protein
MSSAVVCKAPAPKAVRMGARAPARAASVRSVVAKASFKVTLETPEGSKVITCADDMYILDAAEARRAAASRNSGCHPTSDWAVCARLGSLPHAAR